MSTHITAPRRVLVTGSRHWTDTAAVWQALSQVHAWTQGHERVLVHGACPTGVDTIAAGLAAGHGWTLEPHPANWDAYGKYAGPKRNQEMVNAGATYCIGFPLPDSRGTWHCMGAAVATGIMTYVWQERELVPWVPTPMPAQSFGCAVLDHGGCSLPGCDCFCHRMHIRRGMGAEDYCTCNKPWPCAGAAA